MCAGGGENGSTIVVSPTATDEDTIQSYTVVVVAAPRPSAASRLAWLRPNTRDHTTHAFPARLKFEFRSVPYRAGAAVLQFDISPALTGLGALSAANARRRHRRRRCHRNRRDNPASTSRLIYRRLHVALLFYRPG